MERNISMVKIKNIAPVERANPLRVLELVEKLKANEEIPAIKVRAVEHGMYWLKDGSHRIHAFRQSGKTHIHAELV